MATTSHTDPGTGGSSALSLLELRRQLIRRSESVAARARLLRQRGHVVAARRLEEQAVKLREVARSVRIKG